MATEQKKNRNTEWNKKDRQQHMIIWMVQYWVCGTNVPKIDIGDAKRNKISLSIGNSIELNNDIPHFTLPFGWIRREGTVFPLRYCMLEQKTIRSWHLWKKECMQKPKKKCNSKKKPGKSFAAKYVHGGFKEISETVNTQRFFSSVKENVAKKFLF